MKMPGMGGSTSRRSSGPSKFSVPKSMPRREQRIGTALTFKNPSMTRSRSMRGSAPPGLARKGPQLSIQPVKVQGPSYRGSVGLSDGSRTQMATQVGMNAYKGFANSISRATKSPSFGPGLRLPSFETHFDIGDPFKGIGDSLRQSNPIDFLFDRIGNTLKKL